MEEHTHPESKKGNVHSETLNDNGKRQRNIETSSEKEGTPKKNRMNETESREKESLTGSSSSLDWDEVCALFAEDAPEKLSERESLKIDYFEKAQQYKKEKNYELMVENFKLALLQDNFNAAYELGLYYHHIKNFELMETYLKLAEDKIYLAARFLCKYYYLEKEYEKFENILQKTVRVGIKDLELAEIYVKYIIFEKTSEINQVYFIKCVELCEQLRDVANKPYYALALLFKAQRNETKYFEKLKSGVHYGCLYCICELGNYLIHTKKYVNEADRDRVEHYAIVLLERLIFETPAKNMFIQTKMNSIYKNLKYLHKKYLNEGSYLIYLKKLVESDCADSMIEYGEYCFNKQKFSESIFYLEKALNKNMILAGLKLLRFYYGNKKNPDQAFVCLNKLVEIIDSKSCKSCENCRRSLITINNEYAIYYECKNDKENTILYLNKAFDLKDIYAGRKLIELVYSKEIDDKNKIDCLKRLIELKCEESLKDLVEHYELKKDFDSMYDLINSVDFAKKYIDEIKFYYEKKMEFNNLVFKKYINDELFDCHCIGPVKYTVCCNECKNEMGCWILTIEDEKFKCPYCRKQYSAIRTEYIQDKDGNEVLNAVLRADEEESEQEEDESEQEENESEQEEDSSD